MKKSLSIKNSQGVYVARASFSSDETIIDFVKHNNKPNNCSDSSIASSTVLPIEPNFETQSIQSLPTSPVKRSKRRNPVNKVLKILHLKRKSLNKMKESGGGYDTVASTSSLTKPSMSKRQTATLAKKVSIVKKSGDGTKKSAIPIRSATSVETISHSLTANSPTTLSTTTATLSVSEMNLVNIDYRQEESIGSTSSCVDSDGGFSGGKNSNIDLQVDRRTQFQNIHSKFDGSDSGRATFGERAHGSNSRIPTGRSGRTNQLQITISGTKRSSNVKIEEPQLMHCLESMESRRPAKFNSSRGGIALNTIGVPPAPTTQAPSMPYRITSSKIENVVHDDDSSHTKSVMSAPSAAPEAAQATPIDRRAKQLPSKLLTIATATSLDCDDLEEIAHPSTPDERRNSLLTEIVEAENREPMTKLPERGRRYPGMAASETIKFQLQTKSNTELDEEAAKALTTVAVPTVRIDSPAAVTNPDPIDVDATTNDKVSEDNEQQMSTIQIEVGKEVRPSITSQTNLHQNISTTYDNDPIATTFGSMSLKQDYAIATHSPHSHVCNSASVTLSLPRPTSPQTQTATETHHQPIPIDTDDESHRENYAKQQHHRRRIAYIAHGAENDCSPSTSHSIEDEDLIATTTTTTTTTTATNTTEYCDQFRFNSTLTQFSDTLITDYYMMPAYGDLVWGDDGVKNTQLNTRSTTFFNFSLVRRWKSV